MSRRPPLSTRTYTLFPSTTLFRSWAGSLAPAQFEKWVVAPTAEIVARLKALHPDTPIIGFPKGAGAKLAAYARGTGVDALGLDETVDPIWAHATLPEGFPLQCILDPLVLNAVGAALRPDERRLGHGCVGRW